MIAVRYERIAAAPPDPRAVEDMVAMRDGVRLATDVYLVGDGAAAGPAILIRLPYDKSGEYTLMPATAAHMNGRGYHVVVQDVRGKFRSEGETVMFTHEAADGYDTIEWVVQQPWCDGAVAMWGDSYYGFTQFAAVSAAHPSLRAIAPRLTGTRLGALPSPRPGERTSEVEMGVHRLYPCTYFQSNDVYEWEMDWSRVPLADAVEEWFATIGHRSPTYDAWLLDPDAVERFPLGHPFDAPPVPTLMTIGWWDNCAPWQWADHELMTARPEWAAHEYLLLEALDHENVDLADVPVGPEHVTDLPRSIDPALDFFDVFVRDLGSPADVPRVRYTIAGTGRVVTADEWPPADAAASVWRVAAPGEELRWRHDPLDPVPSPVDNAFAFLAEYPDERSLAERGDVLAFHGTAIDDDVVLAGPITFEATVASSGPEMDVFARLCDVSPDGAAHLIARGQVTVYDAHEPAEVTIAMGHTAYLLRAGHYFRLTVASSDSPEFVVAPGTGEHRWLATGRATNDQRLADATLRMSTL